MRASPVSQVKFFPKKHSLKEYEKSKEIDERSQLKEIEDKF